MAAASKVTPIMPAQSADRQQKSFSAKDRIDKALTPELVIALCGPLGTPLHRVSEILQQLLEKFYDYEYVDTIRLSAFIKEHGKPGNPDSLSDLIDAGNKLREKNSNSVLAQLAIRKIAANREQQLISTSSADQAKQDGTSVQALPAVASAVEASAVFSEPQIPVIAPAVVRKNCHIIDSIKNKDELHLLRSVYGKLLHVISVHTPLPLRTQRLETRLGDRGEVWKLIDRDSGEEFANGQSVKDVFPLADFFLRVDDGTDEQIRSHLQRYLDLLLDVRVITPTPSERAMYAAYSAARNSACLSRQVGAAITDDQGEVLAVGWNDVPRAFGGLYESGPLPSNPGYVDHRCWNKDGGKCHNDEEKDEIATRLTKALVVEKIIDAGQEADTWSRLRKSSELRGLIEFSRAVHAEMHALLNAGHSAGGRIRGGKLFVTTYPCHSCARHLIASGIREVRFIEPYRKSLATRLHADAITESESDMSKVRIVPFDGVAPACFLDLFSGGSQGRKDPDTGRMRLDRPSIPLTAVTLEAITTLESLAIKELKSTLLA